MAISTGKVVALIQAMGSSADPAVIESAVQDWLDAHPEATTTVQDGSITEAKLATTVAQKLGLISSLSDEIVTLEIANFTDSIIIAKDAGKTINSAGQIANSTNTDIYIANIDSGKTLLVEASANMVYAFFSTYPAFGVTGVGGRKNLSSGVNEIIVPADVKYIAVLDLQTHIPTVIYKGSLQDRVKTLESDVDVLEITSADTQHKIGDLYTTVYTNGAYVDASDGYAVLQTTGVSGSYKTWIFDCIGYVSLDVTTYASTERSIFVTDDNFKILSQFSTGTGSATTKTTTTVSIPNGGTKLIIPCYYANGYDISLSGISVSTEIHSVKALIESHFPDISTINPCDYTGNEISVFRKILCIGDSFTQGGFNADSQNPDDSQGFADYSYPTVLSRLTGATVTNMGHGGETAQSWNRTYTSTITGGYDACIILLGINDCANYGSFNADSQAALGAIIAKVQQENPHIKIFISTIPIYPAYDTSAIRASTQIIKDYIASLANADLYVMDMETNNHLRDSVAYQYGHPTALGYARLAQDYHNYISWIINQNLEEFRWVQFIGTNYTHNN